MITTSLWYNRGFKLAASTFVLSILDVYIQNSLFYLFQLFRTFVQLETGASMPMKERKVRHLHTKKRMV